MIFNVNHKVRFIFIFILLNIAFHAPISSSVGLKITDKSLLIVSYSDNGAEFNGVNTFLESYSTRNTVVNFTDIDLTKKLTKDIDGLFLNSITNINENELDTIDSWFSSSSKVLWINGEGDWDGGYSHIQNKVLERINSILRLDGGQFSDPISNDVKDYRPYATKLGSGSIAMEISKDLNKSDFRMLFHKSTAVLYAKNGEYMDLRDYDGNEQIEVLVSSSPDGYVIDNDQSETELDFYVNKRNGSFPLLVVEKINKNYVIVSGTINYGDWKGNYGNSFRY
ncbi:MAG: hypothetical protein ACXAC7_09530, partial [Candidatus Hodarchaeales archaeon]